MKTDNRVAIIANGFQQDYISNLVWGLSKISNVILIGSDDYMKYNFNSNVIFKNLRGSHEENVSILKKILRVLLYYFKLISFLVKSQTKIIHIQWMRFFLIDGVFISLFARMFGKTVIYTVHDVLPHDKETNLNRMIFRLIYKSQNILIAHTNYIKQRLVNEFKIKEKKVFVVEHGVYQVSPRNGLNLELARNALSLHNNDFVFLFFGRIARYKGIEMLINSFAKLCSDFNNLKLVIAGKLSDDFKTDFDDILKNADLSNILLKIYFIDDEEVEVLFNSANVTVLPYKEASQSGVLFLSYAYGVPVVAPNLGGFPDYLIKERTGLLFDPGNESSFYSSIKSAIDLFNDPTDNDRKIFIKNFAQNNYSWDASCKHLTEIYNNHL